MYMKTVVGRAFIGVYRELIAEHVRQVPFWMLVGFLPTFIAERLLVAKAPELFVQVQGIHVHHFTWGILLLAIVGFISLLSPRQADPYLAVLYGVGLALAFDEAGMWLKLTANYNLELSENVMAGILVFLVIAVYFTDLLCVVIRIISVDMNDKRK
jgi:hypothetical protein